MRYNSHTMQLSIENAQFTVFNAITELCKQYHDTFGNIYITHEETQDPDPVMPIFPQMLVHWAPSNLLSVFIRYKDRK